MTIKQFCYLIYAVIDGGCWTYDSEWELVFRFVSNKKAAFTAAKLQVYSEVDDPAKNSARDSCASQSAIRSPSLFVLDHGMHHPPCTPTVIGTGCCMTAQKFKILQNCLVLHLREGHHYLSLKI